MAGPGWMPESFQTGSCWRLVSLIRAVREQQQLEEFGRSLAEIVRQVDTFNSAVREVLQDWPNRVIPVIRQRPLCPSGGSGLQVLISATDSVFRFQPIQDQVNSTYPQPQETSTWPFSEALGDVEASRAR